MNRNPLLLSLFGILSWFIANTVAKEAVLGGLKAGTDQFPYLVALKSVKHGESICGGSIIDEQFILTAANCVIGSDDKFKSSRMYILAGTNNSTGKSVRTVKARIKKIYVPKEYKNPPRKAVGDIAVIKLKEPLKLDTAHRYLKVIKIATRNSWTYSTLTASIAGFGYTWVEDYNFKVGGKNNDSLLRYTHADILKSDECEESLFESEEFWEKHMCARVKQSHDHTIRGTCFGDNGGPLVFENTVVGVLSASPESCSERNYPAIYTRVSKYRDFIFDAMKDKTSGMRTHTAIWF